MFGDVPEAASLFIGSQSAQGTTGQSGPLHEQLCEIDGGLTTSHQSNACDSAIHCQTREIELFKVATHHIEHHINSTENTLCFALLREGRFVVIQADIGTNTRKCGAFFRRSGCRNDATPHGLS